MHYWIDSSTDELDKAPFDRNDSTRLALREADRARRRRAVADWRTLPQIRIAGTAPPFDSAAPVRRRGWSTLQRHRIDRRRRLGVRAAW